MMFANRISSSTSCSIWPPETSPPTSSRDVLRHRFQSCNTSVSGFGVEIYLSRARSRRQTPGWGRLPFADGVIDLAGLIIDHIGQPHPWAGPVFVGPWRSRWQGDHLMLARREDEGDVTVRRRGAAWAGCVAPLRRHRGQPTYGDEEGRRKLDRPDPPAREAEPAVDSVLEEVVTEDAVCRHAALGMANDPERGDVVLPIPVEHIVHNIAQMGVIRRSRPVPHGRLGGRRWRGDNQAILLFVLESREVGALPCADRTAPVQAQEEHHLVAGLKIVWIVKIELATGLFVHCADAAHACFPRHTDLSRDFRLTLRFQLAL